MKGRSLVAGMGNAFSGADGFGVRVVGFRSEFRYRSAEGRTLPDRQVEWRPPSFPNTLERNRARMYYRAYVTAVAQHFLDRTPDEVRSENTKAFEDFEGSDEAIGVGFHENVPSGFARHLVVNDGKIAAYHPYPATPWSASPRNLDGTPA